MITENKFQNDEQNAPLRFMSNEEKNDFNLVLEEVKKRGISLYYASNELKNNIHIAEAAIMQDQNAWSHVGADLRQNREFILKMVQQEANTLYFASEELKNDKEIVVAAINFEPYSLAYASIGLRSNRDIVIDAYKKRTSAIQFAAPSLLGDKDFIKTFILENPYVFSFARDNLKSNREFVREIISKAGRALQYVDNDFKKDRELVHLAVENFRWAFEYASDDLKDDKDFVMELLDHSGQTIRYASDRLRTDIELAEKALQNYPWALEYIHESIKDKLIITTKHNIKKYPVPNFEKKIIHPQDIAKKLNSIKQNKPLVFTNGCFDIIHRGHVTYLAQARSLGKSMIVALNTDESVRRQGKGDDRPINSLENRLAVIASLESVDYVTYFNDDTPLELILQIMPDILVKGGDWTPEKIVGSSEVLINGGEVHSIPFLFQTSTTKLVEQIRLK